MNAVLFLLPLAAGLGFVALLAFLWALRAGQFEDPDGDGARLLFDEDGPSRSADEWRKR